MKNHASQTFFQTKPIELKDKRSILPSFSKKNGIAQNSSSQNSNRLPFLLSLSDEPTQIRKILYYKPKVSAKSWIIIDGFSGQVLDSFNEKDQREIASLTKIMTCVVVIQEVLKHKLSFGDYTEVSKKASEIDGTSAGLESGDLLSVWDLLHGLMLPSGNDAALALAEHIGSLTSPQNPIPAFTFKMNKLAQSLSLCDTVFQNPHGMSNTINLSSAKSIAKITLYALKIPIFRRIVQSNKHTCSILNKNITRNVTWINTNRLLRKGFHGVKTGYTPAAGPCLCSFIEQKNKKLLIVMLNVKSMQSRWEETIKIWRWANAYILNYKNYKN